MNKLINEGTRFRLTFVRVDGAREYMEYGSIDMVRAMSVSSGKSKWTCVLVELLERMI